MSQLKFVKENKAAILKVLREHGVKTIQAEYSGSNDDGGFNGVYLGGGANEILTLPLTIQVEEDVYSAKTQTNRQVIATKALPLSDAFRNLCYDLLDHHYEGYEDGDGAYGSFVLNVKTGKLAWEHHEMKPHTKKKTL